MAWEQLSPACKRYLIAIYMLAIPTTAYCFRSGNNAYSTQWFLLTGISLFVATVNLRLPNISSVISMGDVFTILALAQFGAGPALIMYWSGMVVGHLADVVRRYGISSIRKIKAHKFFFNVACCPLCVAAMSVVYRGAMISRLSYPLNFLVGLFLLALAWFFLNTVSLSIAISFWSHRTFAQVWREGLGLALLNFMGSAAAAGLISLVYRKTEFLVFLLSLPIAVVLYQLYSFYIEKFEQARTHIAELNKLYLQTIEALASAVDAKDRYTHGHIRRVQAYAAELALRSGINDQKEILAIQAGALLHDIGKIAIPEYILNKPTTLTETEYEKMKIHPVVGASMLSTIEFPYPLIPLVKSHHERWDGQGYPEGLAGEQIPLSARILALVDCYDALTTNRPYRAPMDRQKIIEFFNREAGRAYDPKVVQTFLDNIDEIDVAGRKVQLTQTDLWGIKEIDHAPASIRPLERVHPVITYGKALNAEADVQRELYSVFEFARAEFHCLPPVEIFSFMGRRLSNLVSFDTAVFYSADLAKGILTATHTVGSNQQFFEGLSLPLEQKLTGWVAANNQSLCNLPPFPDFLNFPDPKPAFQISAIVPINHQNEIFGAISLYRLGSVKFTDDEFRRIEIIGSQSAILLSKSKQSSNLDVLMDPVTGLPNGFQLYLIFDRLAVDAARYEYPFALLTIRLEEVAKIRQKWGHLSGEEAIRATANYLRSQLRETDFLVRYAADEFIAVNPKMTRDVAEGLKSRLQNDLDHFKFAVRSDSEIPLRASIGIGCYPDDGENVENLLSVCFSRTQDDTDLRSAVKRGIRRFSAKN